MATRKVTPRKLTTRNATARQKHNLKSFPWRNGRNRKEYDRFEYGENITVIDCGLAFPEDEMLGIDLVIPDITYLEKNGEKIRGIILTHGHEDHIGALPYVLKRLQVPVYGTELTLALVENKLLEHDMIEKADLRIVRQGQTIQMGPFKVEFIRSTHSIADAVALAIDTPVGWFSYR